MTQTKKLKKKIPEFKSYEEEANFWDTHNIMEYDEFETVELEVDKNLFHTLSIRLNSEILDKLKKRAEKKGLGVTTFIRMWLREHLEEQEEKEAREREHKHIRHTHRS
jgi:predicted DNA binding CopG/RHH family protein